MYNYYLITNTDILSDGFSLYSDVLKGNGPAIPAADFDKVIQLLMEPCMGFVSYLKLLVVNTGDYGCPNWDCEHFSLSAMEAGVDCGYKCPIADQPLTWTGSDRVFFEAFGLDNLRIMESEHSAKYRTYPLCDVEEEGYPMMAEFMDFLPEYPDEGVLFCFYKADNVENAEEPLDEGVDEF